MSQSSPFLDWIQKVGGENNKIVENSNSTIYFYKRIILYSFQFVFSLFIREKKNTNKIEKKMR